MSEYPKFPIFVDIAGWPVLVIGGGSIASRRIHTLIRYGAQIVLVAPEITGELEEMVGNGEIDYRRGAYEEKILTEKPWKMILTATDDMILNHGICELVNKLGIPVNNAGDQKDCDFFFPAVVLGEHLSIGIVSDGSDHHLVRKAASEIRKIYEE